MNEWRGQSDRTRRRGLVAVVGIVLVALIAGAGYGLWYLFLQPSGPAAVSGATLPPVPSSAASLKPLGSGGVAGTWNVDTSIGSFADFSDSFVGYRVQEQLASIGANVAVGRTPNVSGSLTIAGTQVTAVNVTADLTTLKSNDDRRDGQLRHQAIETSSFPTATFALTTPIELGSVPADGREVKAIAMGTLTLHGVTKAVQIPITAKLSGSVIEVTGDLTIAWADYSIQKPNSFAVVTVADEATMELQLFFAHA